MSGIFLSYRQNRRTGDGGSERRVHAQLVEAIADRLGRHFGSGSVFLDTTLRLASRYPDELRDRLERSGVLVMVVHREWLADLAERAAPADKHRDDKDKDWVHFELATAIELGIPVLPLLIDGATQPTARELPGDIAEFAHQQAHRIQFGQWEHDVRRLIDAVERHVPTDPVPPPRDEPEPSLHSWYGPLVTGAAAAVVPFVAARLLVEDAAARVAWLTAVAAAMAFMLGLVLAMVGVMGLLRRPLDELDRVTAERPHDEKTNVIIGLTIAGLGIVVLLTGDVVTPQLQILSLAVIAAFVITMGSQWLRHRATVGVWPQPRLKADPASIRGALSQVHGYLTTWEAPLSRSQRDQTSYALDQLRHSAARLDDLRRAPRRTWWRRSSRWLVHLHAGWLAASVGAAVAAFVTYQAAGGRHWSAVAWLAGCVGFGVAAYLATIERVYRLHRWRRQVVVDAVPDRLAELEALLRERSIPARRAADPARA